ncbi:MAG: hypothetical protein MZV63_41600 [Marinilabiliales bacterium]|nr:hypothetical protein [Marinilabiliales bacterium]
MSKPRKKHNYWLNSKLKLRKIRIDEEARKQAELLAKEQLTAKQLAEAEQRKKDEEARKQAEQLAREQLAAKQRTEAEEQCKKNSRGGST